MISQEEAKHIAEEYINNRYPLDDNDSLTILDKWNAETTYYWIFHYQSRLFIETDNPVYFIMFHPPIYVQKQYGFCRLAFPKGTEKSFIGEEDLEI